MSVCLSSWRITGELEKKKKMLGVCVHLASTNFTLYIEKVPTSFNKSEHIFGLSALFIAVRKSVIISSSSDKSSKAHFKFYSPSHTKKGFLKIR